MSNNNDKNLTIKKAMILDVDVGTDDAWAMYLALKNEKDSDYEVKAITCVFGNSNVQNISKNVLRVLNTVNRLDIPVYVGCNEPLIVHESNNKNGEKEPQFHGENGLCDIHFDYEPDMSVIRKEHAVEAMHKIICSESNVVLMCLGPLTNLAMLFKMYPETKNKLDQIYIMGGNRHGMGNITRTAEFNFYSDPEAAFIVFQSVECPVKLVPLETLHFSAPISLNWRLEGIGKIENSITRFMNPIERKAYKSEKQWLPYDAFTVACYLDPTIIVKSEKFHITIELGGFFTRGQVVVDHIKLHPHNVEIIEEVDVEKFKTLISKIVTDTE